MPKPSISVFTEKEEQYLSKSQAVRDKFFHPFCEFLTKMKVKANHLSLLSFLQIIPFVLFFPLHKGLALFFGVLSLLFDYLDGPLARYQKTSGSKGQFTDLASDNFFFFFVVLTFIYFHTIDGFWGSLYLFNYIFLVVFAVIIKAHKQKLFLIIRNKYYFYLLFNILVFSGQNYFDPFLVFFSIYMTVTNLFLFHKVRCLM